MVGRNEAGGEWLQIIVPQHRAAAALGRRRLRADSCVGAVQARPSGPAAVLRRCRRRRPTIRARRSPPLDALDRGVLEVCGAWGSRPARARFPRHARPPGGRATRCSSLYAGLDRAHPRRPVSTCGVQGRAHRRLVRRRRLRARVLRRATRRRPGRAALSRPLPGAAGAGPGRADDRPRVPRHRGRPAGLHGRRALPAARRRPLRTACPKGYAYDLGAARPADSRPRWPTASCAGSAGRRCACRRSRSPLASRTSPWSSSPSATRSAPSTPTYHPPATAAGARPAAPAAGEAQPPSRGSP